jgi:hypothetical protein
LLATIYVLSILNSRLFPIFGSLRISDCVSDID